MSGEKGARFAEVVQKLKDAELASLTKNYNHRLNIQTMSKFKSIAKMEGVTESALVSTVLGEFVDGYFDEGMKGQITV